MYVFLLNTYIQPKEQQGLPLAILIDVDVCLSLSCCYASKVHADPSL